MAFSATFNSVTFTFDTDMTVGAFATGEPYVVSDQAFNITSIDPASALLDGGVAHGAMKDPFCESEQGFDQFLGTGTASYITAANTTYNNTPANRQMIDLNFTIVDNNAIVRDINIDIQYYEIGLTETSATSILTDWNAFSKSDADQNCVGTSFATPGKDCTYHWTMPLNTVLLDGQWRIDANVQSYYPGGTEYGNYDTNSDRVITINNKMANIATVKGLLQNMIVIIVAMAIAAIASVGALLKPEPLEYAKISFMIGIVAIIVSLIIGFILPLM